MYMYIRNWDGRYSVWINKRWCNEDCTVHRMNIQYYILQLTELSETVACPKTEKEKHNTSNGTLYINTHTCMPFPGFHCKHIHELSDIMVILAWWGVSVMHAPTCTLLTCTVSSHPAETSSLESCGWYASPNIRLMWPSIMVADMLAWSGVYGRVVRYAWCHVHVHACMYIHNENDFGLF